MRKKWNDFNHHAKKNKLFSFNSIIKRENKFIIIFYLKEKLKKISLLLEGEKEKKHESSNRISLISN